MLLWQRAQRRTIVHVLYSRNARDRNYEYLRAFRSTDLAAQGRRVVGLELFDFQVFKKVATRP